MLISLQAAQCSTCLNNSVCSPSHLPLVCKALKPLNHWAEFDVCSVIKSIFYHQDIILVTGGGQTWPVSTPHITLSSQARQLLCQSPGQAVVWAPQILVCLPQLPTLVSVSQRVKPTQQPPCQGRETRRVWFGGSFHFANLILDSALWRETMIICCDNGEIILNLYTKEFTEAWSRHKNLFRLLLLRRK